MQPIFSAFRGLVGAWVKRDLSRASQNLLDRVQIRYDDSDGDDDDDDCLLRLSNVTDSTWLAKKFISVFSIDLKPEQTFLANSIFYSYYLI